MNLDEDVELDRILAGADFTEGGEADQEPGLSPELVGAVATPTVDTVSAQGMAPHKGREGVTQTGEGLCQGPFPSFSQPIIIIFALFNFSENSKVMKFAKIKWHKNFSVYCTPRVLLILLRIKKIYCENSYFVLSFPSSLIQKLYIIYKRSNTPNDCSTMRNFPFQEYSCMRAKIGELWLQTRTTVSFWYANLCILTCTTQNYRLCEDISYIQWLLYSQSCIFWAG